ncbi:unnamed protein product [Mycena citricolor]|uniref:Uncharacterized protein n=1 Tax=Mycena citricolor TaxID=2018698 RepID=A0AAD2HLE3_9AGAR|nr:unnamed protein product [Mycena citricolor]
MFFTTPFASALVMMLTGVNGLPKPFNSDLAARGSCNSGLYQYNSTTCMPCPAGNTCDGTNDPQPCDYGTFQPSTGQTSCQTTTPGNYQPNRGSSSQIPCPAGSYQPYAQQSFCYGAPKGRFQSQPGKAFVCGSCCGWAAPMPNNNVNAVQCTAPTPNSWPSSGDGCISSQTSCTRAATCSQAADGSCPIGSETIRG